MLGRTALGPHPPGSSRSSLERRKRRFLAYSFPPRSPDPHHLAVLTRSDFVGAACHPHRHHPDRAAPSFTALLRQDRQRRSHTPSRIHSASRRTQRRLKIDPFSTGEFDTGSVFIRRGHDLEAMCAAAEEHLPLLAGRFLAEGQVFHEPGPNALTVDIFAEPFERPAPRRAPRTVLCGESQRLLLPP